MAAPNFCDRSKLVWVIVAVLGFSTLPTPAAPQGTAISFDLNFTSFGQHVPVHFTAWMPAGVSRYRGVVFDLPGSGQDTRTTSRSITWTSRLPGMGFGIVGLIDQGSLPIWGGFGNETEANVLLLQNTISSLYGHPEIANAPIITTGVSAGANDAALIAHQMQSRAVCYVCDKGGGTVVDWDNGPGAPTQAPGIEIAGSNDPSVPPSSMYGLFTYSRSVGATNALAIDWNVAHADTSSDLPFAYMAQALRARYPKSLMPSTAPNQPLNLSTDLSRAWLGESNPLNASNHFVDVPSPELAPVAGYSKDKLLASWLPTQAMAMAYKAQNQVNKPLQCYLLNDADAGQGLKIALSMNAIPYDSINVYHDEDLIKSFGSGLGPTNFTWYPTETGIQTIVAIAHYKVNGVATTTSSYFAVGVNNLPEPSVVTGLLILASVPRRRQRKPNGSPSARSL